jgi:hypothetical protein
MLTNLQNRRRPDEGRREETKDFGARYIVGPRVLRKSLVEIAIPFVHRNGSDAQHVLVD